MENLINKILAQMSKMNTTLETAANLGLHPTPDTPEVARARREAVSFVLDAIDQAGLVVTDMATENEPGPTGDFPKGKMNSDDEGGLNIALALKDGRIIMVFETPVAWIGMYPKDADALADLLREKADEARAST